MPHILFIDNVVAFLVVNRDRYPEVATQTVETPQLQFLVAYKWSMSRCAGRADSQVQVWRRQSSPTVAAVENSVEIPRVFLDKVVDMPLLCNDRCLVFGCRKLRILRSCSS